MSLKPLSFAFEPTPSSPSIILEITPLLGSYLIWVGSTETEILPDAALIEQHVAQGRLASDWACAMPGTLTNPSPVGTPLFRTSSTDAALPMAQRLARRYKKQIFLSVDCPPSFGNPGQPNLVLLAMEKNIVKTLNDIESQS